jgi:filamentous hemagglutinin family protein
MIVKIFLISLAIVCLRGDAAHAQVYRPSNRTPIADNTLGTQVTVSGSNFNITGGLNRGTTVLHSFQDFSVPTGGRANFNNPTGTQAVVTRVTGNLSSDINGVVNSQGANFFLINPNGVVFGPNAQLNVGKALVVTTANSGTLVDGSGNAYTFGTRNINDAPLLSINPSVGLNVSLLNFNGSSGKITNFGTLRTTNADQYIGLIGGDITLDAGVGQGDIIAPGGRVDLGGLATAGTVDIDAQGFVYGGTGLVRSDLSLIDGARVDVTTTQPVGNVNTFFFANSLVGGSTINVDATNVRIFNRSTSGASAPDVLFREPIAQPPDNSTTVSAVEAKYQSLPRTRRVSILDNDNRVIRQACSAGDSKFTITGRSGLPATANSPLSSSAVWQDYRATQPSAPSGTVTPVSSLPPAAIGWNWDQHGNIALRPAQAAESAVGANGCPPRP